MIEEKTLDVKHDKSPRLGICKSCKTSRTHLRGDSGDFLCRRCKLKDRVCTRCGRSTTRATKVLEDGRALCAPCSVHYRIPRPCPACGQLSRRLSRNIKFGITEQQVCERCYRKSNINCVICRKNRIQGGLRVDGKPLCKLCYERNGAAFICKTCGCEGVPHSVNSCVSCYWRSYARKQFKYSIDLLSNQWSKDIFNKFFESLINRQDPQKVGLQSLSKYFLFFVKLDIAFSDPKKITPAYLIQTFGINGIFRNNVPYSFLIKEKIIDPISRDELVLANHHKRQSNLLVKAEGAWYESVLKRFYTYMLNTAERCKKNGWVGHRERYRPPTITVTLLSTIYLLNYLDTLGVKSIQQFNQLMLDQFLNTITGYKNGIYAFIRYLNHKEKLFQKLTLVHKGSFFSPNLSIAETKYEELLTMWLGAKNHDCRNAFISILIAIYAQKIKNIVRIKLNDISVDEKGLFTVKVGLKKIKLVEKVSEILNQYLIQRKVISTLDEAELNSYLFPGRGYGEHIKENTVSCYLGKYRVKATQLVAMALFNAYKGGIKQPKVLVKTLGVSLTTAMKYYEMFNSKLVIESNKVMKTSYNYN